MEIPKIKSGREKFSILEGAEYLGWKVDDIIYLAGMGKLTIYVQAENWTAKSIYEIDHNVAEKLGISIKYPAKPRDLLKAVKSAKRNPDSPKDIDLAFIVTGRNPLSESNSPYSKDLLDYNDSFLSDEKVTVGIRTIYERVGKHQGYYEDSWSGLQPIATKSIYSFSKNPDLTKIELDFNKMLFLPSISVERFFCPDPDVLLKDAIKDGKLYVYKTHLERLISNENKLQKKELPNKKGSRPQTLERYADWQRRAVEKIKINPALSAYAVAELIHADLEREKSKYVRSVDAIRQHINI